MRQILLSLFTLFVALSTTSAHADDIKKTDVYRRLKQHVDQIRLIDTHDHLAAFENLPNRVKTDQGEGMTLYSIWAGSYFPWVHPLAPWPASGKFSDWWKAAEHNFDNARATSFYRYLLPAFRDLYGVDFDTITPAQAADLNARIFANYRDDKWLRDVITNRAKIDLMLIDPYWNRLQLDRNYEFGMPVLNVSGLMKGTSPDRFSNHAESPYEYAQKHNLKTDSFDDYLNVIEAIFADAVSKQCICLKSTQAYERTLLYEKVTKERAAKAFGHKPADISAEDQKAFEDFLFWHVCELSAKYDLPFQIHTGQARIQGSNPLLLADVIQANPKTKFILFHGGYPWVGETGVIGQKYRNVWIDSVWLPMLSYTMARRAYQEWLDAMPSDRIMWGADTLNAEGIYGATVYTRECLTEALAEKVDRGELREDHAQRIATQILRENALKLFPKLRAALPK